jgi:hypothetical protein
MNYIFENLRKYLIFNNRLQLRAASPNRKLNFATLVYVIKAGLDTHMYL